VHRSPFRTRARQRIWQETRASIKGRFTPLILAVIGIAVGYFYSLLILHKQTTKEVVTVALVSGIGANLIWFLCALVINTVRVPWLLDAESTGLVNTEQTRAEIAEKKLAEINAARDKHDLFARLMQQGVNFSCQIAECQTDANFASWDRHSNDWIKSVQQAMRDVGFATDAVEFARAAEYAEPITGVITTVSKREERARVLEKHQENLADFVQRRLP
jgi:hypothetical protein